jgi:hypothetical protein
MFKSRNNCGKQNASNSKKCINSVFEKWIMDWRDDAVARDLQSKHTFTKVNKK